MSGSCFNDKFPHKYFLNVPRDGLMGYVCCFLGIMFYLGVFLHLVGSMWF
jgi:hypothetical protein